MEGGSEIEHRSGCSSFACFNRKIQAFRRSAERGDGILILTADEQKAVLRQVAKVNDVLFVLLDDFSASAAAGAATKLVRGGERGKGEDEDGGVRRFAPFTGDEMPGIVRDRGLKNTGEGGQGCEFHFQNGNGAQVAASASVGSSSGEFSAAVRRRN